MLFEEKFYEAMNNMFVGSKIDGKGGYVNLLHIKNKYYKKVIDILKSEIQNDTIVNTDFKEDFYDLLYAFFIKYFSESGSIYFNKTSAHDKIYEKVYENNKDVSLFWKTNMLYYVKTDVLYNSTYITVHSDKQNTDFVFYFDVKDLELKQNNEKQEFSFLYKEKKKGKVPEIHTEATGDVTFVISVSNEKNKTSIEDISASSGINEIEIIEKAIYMFNKQSQVDYFINKNAKTFLEEQLELFLHQRLFEDDNVFDETKLKQYKAFKMYAKKIIDFISQFENELVRIWNKPKFVKNSNYVISIDKLNDDIIKKIQKSKNLKAQIEEWVKLGIVDKNFELNELGIASHPHLPIDTKYFKDLEFEIIGLFDNLDEELNGRLIHSENYQALNSMAIRYKDSIHCIYIDPPFNTGNDFEYMDEYQDSSWLSIMYDRINLAYNLLSDDGTMYQHLDHCSEHRGREIMDEIFKKNNYINTLCWGYRSGGASDSKSLPYKHDSILMYTKDKQKFQLQPVYERQIYEKSFMGAKKDDNGHYYSDTLLRDLFEGEFFDPVNNITFNVRKVLNLSREFYSFKNSQKPEGLIHLLTSLVNNKKGIILDFFAGSGTTLSVALKTKNKFIGVEMGEYSNNFYTSNIEYKNSEKNQKDIYEKFDVIEVDESEKKLMAIVNKVGILGRLKEVVAKEGRHEPCGITETTNWQGGGFFKYYELEQYEDTLSRAVYDENIDTIYEKDKPFKQYVFFADKKLVDVLDASKEDFELDFDKLYENIDLPETISLLLGKPIESIDKDYVKLKDMDKILYNTKVMNNEQKINFAHLLKPLLWWGE